MGLQRVIRNLLGMMDMFATLTLLMVSQMYAYVRTYPIIHFICSLMYVHSTTTNCKMHTHMH